MTITVPLVPESPNVVMRMHYRSRTDYRNRWTVELACQLDGNRNLERHFLISCALTKTRMRVEIVQHRIQLLDPDNLVGSVKVILDAMRPAKKTKKTEVPGLGWLWDDSEKAIKLVVRQTKESKRTLQRTEITIRMLKGANR